MRLYDTATRGLRELPPAPGPVRMYFCGPTVYQRIHIGNARPFVISLWLKRWLERAGYEVALVENITDINDKIYDAAPEASAQLAADASGWYVEDTGDLGLGRPDVEPKATETVPEIVAMIEQLVGLGARLPGGRRRLLPRRELPRLRPALRPPRRRGGHAQPLRGAGAERAQGGPARLRALEGAQGGRGHLVGLALGPRPSRLAHRVLGDGRGSTSGRSSRSTAAGSTSSSRTTRTSSRSRGRSATSSRSSGCTTGCSGSRARRCRSRSATSSRCARRSTRGDARRCSSTSSVAHWRKPIDFSDEMLQQARAQAESFRNVFRSPSETGGDWDGFRRSARRRLQHAGGARGDARLARPRPPAARARGLRARVACRGREAPAEAGGARARTCRGAGAEATSPRGRPAARRDRGRRAGRCATWTPSPASSSSPSGDPELVYGRRAVREALRGPREVLELLATERALTAEPWLRDGGPRVHVKLERELTAEAGTRDHQGVVARVEPYRYADALRARRARAAPLLVVLDQVTDPRNLGAVIRSAEGAGATASSLPAHGSARVTPAVGRASAGAVEHLPRRRRDEPRALPRARSRGRTSGSGPRPGEAETSLWQADLVRAVRPSSSAPRARACARSCAARATTRSRSRSHGRVESLNVSVAAALLLYEARRQRGG